MRAPAAEWAPDQPPLDSPGSDEIKNVYPVFRGYKPIQELVEISTNALTNLAKGYYSAHQADGSTLTFAADKNKLYSYSVTTFTDISRTTGAYTDQDSDLFWEAVQYGDNVIFTTIENTPQYYNLTSSLTFADVGGSPPRARHIAVVRDFLVLGGTNNSNSEVRWSANGNFQSWTLALNEAGSNTLQEGGWVQGVIGGEVGFIIQERQIVRMTYVGGDVIFQFDVLNAGYGCNSPYSIARVGRMAYYKGSDGFYGLSLNDGTLSPIGSEKVDRWFKGNAAAGFVKQMKAAVDPVKKIVWWSFVSNSTSGSTFDMAVGFQWELNRWFRTRFDHEMLTPAFTEAITLDEIDASFPNIDLCPISLDSDYWMGGLTQLRAFSLNHKLALFEGDNLEATIETTEIEPIPGRRSMVVNMRPLTDTSSATVIVESRERLADTATNTIAGVMQTNGDVSLLSSGRYHKVKTVIPAASTWTFWEGCDIDVVDDGQL